MPVFVKISVKGIERTVDADSIMGQLWTYWIDTGKSNNERYRVLLRIAKRWRYGKTSNKRFVPNVSRVVDKLMDAKPPNQHSNDHLEYRTYYAWVLEFYLYEKIHFEKFIQYKSMPNIFDFEIASNPKIEDSTFDLNYKRPPTNAGEFRLGLPSSAITFEPEELRFIERYVNVAKGHLDTLKKSLLIYEYVGKGSSENHPDYLLAYSEAHNAVFRIIEDKISENRKLIYKRLFSLPSISKWGVGTIPPDKLYEELIQKCTEASFEHLVRCLTGPDKNRFTESRSASGFFLVPLSREYHFVLVDNDIIISEYYRYDKFGDCVPDIMLTHSSVGDHKTLERLYQNDFDDLPHIRISKIEEIVSAINRLRASLTKRLGEIEGQDEIYSELRNLNYSLTIKNQILNQVIGNS